MMQSFGSQLRVHRRRCSDPQRGGLLTQERFGELIGLELGDAGYSGAAVSDWERGKSKINADDRLVLVALISVLKQCGGLENPSEADVLLHAGNYRGLNEVEAAEAFPEQNKDSPIPVGESHSAARIPVSPVVGSTDGQHGLSKRRRNQLLLVQKVKRFWIEGVLEKIVEETAYLKVLHRLCDYEIDRPWQYAANAGAGKQPLPRNESIFDAYMSASQALLILGEPGSGKSMTLMELARDLLERAQSDAVEAVPVILNLVSWSERRGGIDRWIVKELISKYQIPGREGGEWLESDELILLLDGFDEVPDHLRPKCAEEINRFRMIQGHTGIAVCSRLEEYQAAGVSLKMGGAISLLPLDKGQIDNYLSDSRSATSGLIAAVEHNQKLEELAQTPLMLSMMVKAYSSMQGELGSLTTDAAGQRAGSKSEWYGRLIDSFVKGMLTSGLHPKKYSEGTSIKRLGWLARTMSEHKQGTFLLEQIQPSFLRNRLGRWSYMILSGITAGAVCGLLMWLFLQILRESQPGMPAPISETTSNFLRITQGRAEFVTIAAANILLGLIVAVMQTLYFEGLQRQNRELESYGWPYRRHLLLVGIVIGSLSTATAALISRSGMAFAWGVFEMVLFVTVARFVYGRSFSTEIRTVESLDWSWSKAAEGTVIGLILAGTVELFGVIIFDAPFTFQSFVILGLGCLIFGGLRGRKIDAKSRPNQGIYLSLRNSFVAAGLSAVILGTAAWVVQTPSYALLTALIVFIAAGSLFGGGNVFKHFLVRGLLWVESSVPWRYVTFLDYASSLTLLRKVGGGYIFSHRLIQLYFATADPPGGTASREEDEGLAFRLALESELSTTSD